MINADEALRQTDALGTRVRMLHQLQKRHRGEARADAAQKRAATPTGLHGAHLLAKVGFFTYAISVSTMLPCAAAGMLRQSSTNSCSPGVAAESPLAAPARNMNRAKHSRTDSLWPSAVPS